MNENTSKENNNIITADEINWRQQYLSHPTYKYLQFYPNTYGQPINITQSLSMVTFNLPPNECINFSKSYLTWTDQFGSSTVAGQSILVGTTVWIPNDTCGEFQRYQLQPSNSTWIVDLDYGQNYLQLVSKSETGFSEFMTRDPYLDYMSPSNCPNINNLRPDSSSTIAASQFSPIISNGTQNYIEPSYLYSFTGTGTALNIAPYYLQRMLRLGDIKNTFFSVDRDFYFGGQISYMRLYCGVLSKLGWYTTSPNDPITGATSLTGVAPYTVSMNNLTLYLAIESNELIRQDILRQATTTGLKYLIPYVQAYKNSYGAVTSQQITIQFDLSLGKSLKKIYHSIYNGSETNAMVYEHSNIDGGTNVLTFPPVYGKRISNFWTILNGRRMEDLTLNSIISSTTSANSLIPTDYMSLKNKLKGSVILNSAMYQAGWFWLDSFDGFSSIMIQNGCPHIVSGIPMGAVALVWTFNGNVMGAAQNAHYTYGVFYRELLITTALVTVN